MENKKPIGMEELHRSAQHSEAIVVTAAILTGMVIAAVLLLLGIGIGLRLTK